MSLNDDDKQVLNPNTVQNDVYIKNPIDLEVNSNEKFNMNSDESTISLNKEKETILKVNENKNRNIRVKSYLLYGNHIDNLHPKYLGKSRAFLYINNYPLIIIGPDCKFYNLYILRLL